jgi:hypothetical protein
MLPVVLLLWEAWLGKRRWKRLMPFFAVSLLFGLQGALLNPNVDNDYTLRFTPAAFWASLKYYSSRVLLIPFGGFLLILVAWGVKDRKVRFGLAAMALLFLPLLFLPGRLFSAYCYLPLAGLAIAAGALAARYHAAFAALFLLAWLPWNFGELRARRRHVLAVAEENRAYVSTVSGFMQPLRVPLQAAVYAGAPEAFHRWGVEAALRYFSRQDLMVCAVEDPCAAQALGAESVAVFSWDPRLRTLVIAHRVPGRPQASYISMDRTTPLWQLTAGWYPLEEGYRWTAPVATAGLERPAAAREFELVINAGPRQLREQGKIGIRVMLDGVMLGRGEFSAPGWHKARWPLQDRRSGPLMVEFRADSEYRPAGDRRRLGAAVVAFGFPP